MSLTQAEAVALLQGLVSIPSLSHQEARASRWLVEQMRAAGYDRAFVDAAGNAVGELGAVQAERTLLLLGHIDTVPGTIPVRVEPSPEGELLYGRGSVDAKGPLATFVTAAARVGSAWAHAQGIRLVVAGAVEEEAASSKGARFLRDRFDGLREPPPAACIVGEPSHWSRVTLGYKGRLWVELEATQPMAHTAGPDAGVATVAVDFWNWLSRYADRFNVGREKAFDQLLPSLRRLATFTDDAMHDHVVASCGVRLPLNFSVDSLAAELAGWAGERVAGSDPPAGCTIQMEQPSEFRVEGTTVTLTLRFSAYEPAWRSDRSNPLVRSFLQALRQVAPEEKLGFVLKTGTSDMNVVGPAWSCPIVAYGPGDSSLDHTPHEHLRLADYWQAVLVLEQALRHGGQPG